jgi:hypothetical protein
VIIGQVGQITAEGFDFFDLIKDGIKTVGAPTDEQVPEFPAKAYLRLIMGRPSPPHDFMAGNAFKR